MADGVTTSLSKNVSRAELSQLTKHLKDEKFRTLLTEFANEVSAPGKKEQFEKEVIALEAERGVQVVFVEPKPGFAIALQLNKKNKDQSHVYVNICSSDVVEKPKCTRIDTGDKKGLNWALPHLVPQPRKEVLSGVELPGHHSNSKDALLVHDVVFHPDALHLAARNRLMRDTVLKSAVDSLVTNYKFSVKCNIEIEKVEYVGKIARSVVRKVVNEKLNKQSQSEENVSFPPPQEENQVESDERTSKIQSKNEKNAFCKKAETNVNKDGTLKPVHRIKYVNRKDLQDYAIPIIPQCGAAYRPNSLEVTIELPCVDRASQVDVDITHQHLVLTTDSKPKYNLDLNLPYPVDEELSQAKFDVATKYLILTLSVIESRSKAENINVCSPASDSGIECESGYRTNSDGDNSSEVSVSSQEGCDEQSCVGEDQDISVWDESEAEIKSKALLIPSYNISQSKDKLEISMNAGNVLAESVNVICNNVNQVEVSYSSIGGGYVPLHYQLVILCPHNVLEESIEYNIHEHTFDIHIPKKESVQWKTVQVGNHDNLTAVEIGNSSEIMLSSEKSDETSESTIHTSTESVIKDTLEESLTQAVIKTETEVEVVKTAELAPPEVIESGRKSRLCRAVSECESQATANRKRQGLTGSWPRGILKRRTRSLSLNDAAQSGRFSPSIDALSSLGSSQELETNVEVVLEGADDDDDAISSSVKKSVRFNEVVSRQLFRSNSSIVGGQGAKNQKKNKKEKVPLLDENDRDSCSDSSPHKNNELLKYLEKLDSDITTTDSNTETEDINEATENIDPNVKSKKQVQGNNNNNNNIDKNGKKNKRNKKKLELSNNMIFQLDIEA